MRQKFTFACGYNTKTGERWVNDHAPTHVEAESKLDAMKATINHLRHWSRDEDRVAAVVRHEASGWWAIIFPLETGKRHVAHVSTDPANPLVFRWEGPLGVKLLGGLGS